MDQSRKNFAWPTTAMDQEDYDGFCQWYAANAPLLKTHQLFIWGAGIRGTAFSILLREKGIGGFFFVDTNSEKWGGYIDNFPILSPNELEHRRENEKQLILISVENSVNIQRELDKRGYQKNKNYFAVETDSYASYVKEFLRPYEQKFLIMGDCEFTTISMQDTRHDSLKEKLYRHYGKQNTKILAMHGMGLRAQYNIFHAQLLQGMKPECFVLMVNFDTLTGKQHLLPRSQHTELLEMLLNVQKHPTQEFREYVQLTRERSKNLQMEFFVGPEYSENLSDVKARNYLRLNYLYDLDVQSEGIQYLEKILDETAAEHIKILPFIPPVNYQLGKRLLGDEFSQRYESNLAKIRGVIQAHGATVLDLSYCLPSTLFATMVTPSETANDQGREKVASLLYDAVEEMG